MHINNEFLSLILLMKQVLLIMVLQTCIICITGRSVIVLLILYNFFNHNIFIISLKIAVIFKVDKVIVSPCIYIFYIIFLF